jgi:hypothetical protein
MEDLRNHLRRPGFKSYSEGVQKEMGELNPRQIQRGSGILEAEDT